MSFNGEHLVSLAQLRKGHLRGWWQLLSEAAVGSLIRDRLRTDTRGWLLISSFPFQVSQIDPALSFAHLLRLIQKFLIKEVGSSLELIRKLGLVLVHVACESSFIHLVIELLLLLRQVPTRISASHPNIWVLTLLLELLEHLLG